MVFNLHFSDDNDAENPFMHLVTTCYVFSMKCLLLTALALFLHWVLHFLEF